MSKAPRYLALADELDALIRSGALRAGDRLPSVRQTCQSRHLSPATVFQAYYLLESRGLVSAAPRSGYFVNALRHGASPHTSQPSAQPGEVAVSELVFEVLGASSAANLLPLGSAFPAATLFPLEPLRRAVQAGMRKLEPTQITAELPLGHEGLRRQIALRYLRLGISIGPDEIVLTNGALEALNLCLQVLTRPGDAVLVEAPGFYAALQALERLGLRAIEVPTHAGEGADLDAMATLIAEHRPKACWLMTSFQNPLGSLMPADKKRALVALLAGAGIPLIEDDVYAELHHGPDAALPAKAFAPQGQVMHCGSFSKCLAPGYRVGWAAPGPYLRQLQRLKLMSSLGVSLPAQAGLSEYLQGGAYDAHLRRLRAALASQQQAMLAALHEQLPAGSRMTRPRGGYFIWVELPAGCDALLLQRQLLAEGISTAPGPIFSARAEFRHCLRLNSGHPWDARMAAGIARLGVLAKAQLVH